MEHLLSLPHRVTDGMCPVNGIRDLVQWRAGRDWSNPFVFGLALGGGFAYIRVNVADPPRQVFWGNASPRQHRYLAEVLGAGFSAVEGRVFKSAWSRARQAVDAGTPPVIGPLDMYHLPFYEGIYHQRHIPIHYLLVVGYDEGAAYVLDTGHDDVLALPLADLQAAWDVNVPGMGKRNTLAVLDIPAEIPPTAEIIRRSILDECQLMLRPPVSMLGIPAMEKVARDIPNWLDELGEEATARSLEQVHTYLSSPPDAQGKNLTAGRQIYIQFLEEAGPMAGLDFSAAAGCLRETMAVIPALAAAVEQRRLDDAGRCFREIANIEKAAWGSLYGLVRGGD